MIALDENVLLSSGQRAAWIALQLRQRFFADVFHPEISLAIADYYGKIGERAKRDVFPREIADRTGYGEEKATRDACVRLGTELYRSGKTEEARKYLWMAALYAKTIGANVESQERIVQSLKF